MSAMTREETKKEKKRKKSERRSQLWEVQTEQWRARIGAIVIVFLPARSCSRTTASGRSVRGNFTRIDLEATHAGLAR